MANTSAELGMMCVPMEMRNRWPDLPVATVAWA